MIVTLFRPTGPRYPAGDSKCVRISPSLAKRKFARSGSFDTFTSLIWWSPRMSSRKSCVCLSPGTASTTDFTVLCSGSLRSSATSSQVFFPGVGTFFIDSLPCFLFSCGERASASSTFAAYCDCGDQAIASSPESARTWNSCEPVPPIAPVSAATARNLRPRGGERGGGGGDKVGGSRPRRPGVGGEEEPAFLP